MKNVFSKKTYELLRALLNYSKWLAIDSIFLSAILYVARLVLAQVSTPEEVGYFSVSVNFAMGLSLLVSGAFSVLYPQITAFNREQIEKYFRLLKKVIPYYAIASLLTILALTLLFWLILGKSYSPALPSLLVISLSFALSFALSTVALLLHTFMLPKIVAYVIIYLEQ